MAGTGGGGAATAGGMNFQGAISAWLGVRMLAESDASAILGWPDSATIASVSGEANQAVDDILAINSQGGLLFGQAKTSLSLSQSATSTFAGAVDQFTRLYLANRNLPVGRNLWERPLDRDRDRIVLFVGPEAPGTVKNDLRNVLDQVRTLLPTQLLTDAGKRNAGELAALTKVSECVNTAWTAKLSASPSDSELKQVLELVHVMELALSSGGRDETTAKDLLRGAVLANPAQDGIVWNSLKTDFAQIIENKGSLNLLGLQGILKTKHNIVTKAPRSFRADIERLQAISRDALAHLLDLSKIQIGTTQLKIQRQSSVDLVSFADAGSALVTGEPGAGKSGALHDLAAGLQQVHRDIVLIAVEGFEAKTEAELRRELGLERSLTEVLQNWPGANSAFLIIDGLDAARSGPAGRTIREMVRQVKDRCTRWKVVASVRKYDLRYSEDLKSIFAGNPSVTFNDPDFSRIRHLNVPRLDGVELAQIQSQSASLHGLVNQATTELRNLLSVPYNLRLMAELLSSGETPESLTPIRSQIQLLERYWNNRVFRPDFDKQGHAREAVVRRACEGMVSARALKVDLSSLQDNTTSEALPQVLSAHVLVDWKPNARAAASRDVLSFPHNILFDYAVSRTLFRGDTKKLVERLGKDRDLIMVIRPSVVFHFQYLWESDESRETFWDVVNTLNQDKAVPEIAKIVGPGVAGDLANLLTDCQPLVAQLDTAPGAIHSAAEHAFATLVTSITGELHGRPLLGTSSGPWCELMELLSRKLDFWRARWIHRFFAEVREEKKGAPTDAQKSLLGPASRRLVEYGFRGTHG